MIMTRYPGYQDTISFQQPKYVTDKLKSPEGLNNRTFTQDITYSML